jgi:exosortase A
MRRDHIPDLPSATIGVRPEQWPEVRMALATSAVAMVVLVVAYWATVREMVEIWSSNDTFAHGFVVPVISVWLAWRQRASLALAKARPAPWIAVAVAVAGFVWLLGELAQANGVRQFTLVSLVVLAIPTIAGIDIARRLVVPLAFLFFAVPFGDFLLPQLMEWTASFTVLAVKASGVPVYREGLFFVIPSGRWSIVEGCSGVRYLIASVVVGTLYAYLTYRSPVRRIVFIVVSFLVPVVANWLRAYMIVMLGHLSGNRIATGVDHILYGWVFFGIVMSLLFWIAARWREDEPTAPLVPAVGQAPPEARVRLATGLEFALAGVVFLLVALAPLAASRVLEAGSNVPAPRLQPLASIADWSSTPTLEKSWRPHYVQPSAETYAAFRKDGAEIGVYVAYYRNQSAGRKLLTSTNVLVASKDPQWAQVTDGKWQLRHPGLPAEVRTADLSDRGSERLRVWHWYWVDGKWTASPMRAKAMTALAQLVGHGDDSAVVMLVTPEGSGADAAAQADALLESFAVRAVPAIAAILQTTRDDR